MKRRPNLLFLAICGLLRDDLLGSDFIYCAFRQKEKQQKPRRTCLLAT